MPLSIPPSLRSFSTWYNKNMLTREQYQNLLKTLPEELKEALFSVENLEAIGDICDRNGASQFFESVNREMGDVLFRINFPRTSRTWGSNPLWRRTLPPKSIESYSTRSNPRWNKSTTKWDNSQIK